MGFLQNAEPVFDRACMGFPEGDQVLIERGNRNPDLRGSALENIQIAQDQGALGECVDLEAVLDQQAAAFPCESAGVLQGLPPVTGAADENFARWW